jgi:hypothetical protein
MVAIAIAGCNKSDVANQQAAPEQPVERDQLPAVASVDPNTVAATDTPEKATTEFLKALRNGDDHKAMALLSVVAREKTAALNRGLTPAASDTAKFTVGKAKLIGQDGAQVPSTWTDVDDDGQTSSDNPMTWVLRRESEGWRIAGVAAEIFPGEPPLCLNFEDPEDMLKKERWARQEYMRRQTADNQVATETGTPADPSQSQMARDPGASGNR